jgi:hypothetical protein
MEIQNQSPGLILSEVECMKPKRDYCRLGKKQLAVITDIFENTITEVDALAKNHVSKWLYQKWLDNPIFLAELDARFDEALRRSKFLIAHCLPLAVQRLVQLIVSEKEETARKACLDLISLQLSEDLQNFKNPQKQNKKIHPKLTPEKAARMLAMLAEREPKPNSLPDNRL